MRVTIEGDLKEALLAVVEAIRYADAPRVCEHCLKPPYKPVTFMPGVPR